MRATDFPLFLMGHKTPADMNISGQMRDGKLSIVTINDMTLAIASLHPRRTTDWYNREFPDKKIDPRTDIVLNKLVHQK